MRVSKFFRIGIALAACALALFLAGEAAFISVAWAGKPDHARKTHTEYGYAMFNDDYAIRSDGAQYIDCNVQGESGEDLVQIVLFDDDGTLKYVEVFVGRMKGYYPNSDESTRRVNFWFNVSNISGDMTDFAVRDILRWYKDGNDYVERSANPGYLDDNSVHFPIKVYADGSTSWVQFVVDPDPGYNGADTRAITQATVDAFYGEDIDYWDNCQANPQDEYCQIIYSLDFGSEGFFVEADDRDNDGEQDTWIFTAKPVTVKLFVIKYTYSSKGNSGNTQRVRETVYLAEYENLPFQFAVSLNSLSDIDMAPRRHNTLSTTWGGIKAK